MALSSRKKRRAFRNPKRVRRGGSSGFNFAVAAILIVGTILVLVSRHPNSAGAVGPKLHDSSLPADSTGQHPADHWHAAIGVYVCGVGWEPAPIWQFWNGTSYGTSGTPVRVGTTVYAGLHSHILSSGLGDGIIHMEPSTTDEAGRNATVGKWTEFGGWKLTSSSMSLWTGANGKPIKYKNGDKCPGGKTGKLRWAVGQFSPGKTTKLVEQKGNPAHFKLYDQDVVAIYFVPSNQDLTKLGSVPSEKNLPSAAGLENGQNSTSSTMPNSHSTTTTPGATTTVKPGSAATSTTPPTTAASSSTTSKP